jgi:hypothetical protein
LTEIERAAFAADRVWSLLATWGGSGGYGDIDQLGMIGGGSFGTCGCDGGFDTIGHGTLGIREPRLDLRDQFARVVAACEPGTARIDIEIETTVQEIVDVGVTVTNAGARTGTVHDCVVDGVWDTFVAIPNAPAHATTRFAFGV